jgi:hypothetical protein
MFRSQTTGQEGLSRHLQTEHDPILLLKPEFSFLASAGLHKRLCSCLFFFFFGGGGGFHDLFSTNFFFNLRGISVVVPYREPNRANKPPDEKRRLSHAELKFSPSLGQSPWAPGAHLLAQSGYFSSLWVKSFVRDFWKPGRYKAKHRYFTSFC